MAEPRSETLRLALTGATVVRLAAALLTVALVYRFFDAIARVLLVLFAAATLAVVLNTLVRRIPVGRKWVTAVLAFVLVAGLGAAFWFGGPLLLEQLRGFVQELPQIEQTVQQWAETAEEQTGLPVPSVLERAAGGLQRFATGGQILGRARSMLEVLALPLIILAGALFALAKPNDRLLVPALRAIPHSHRAPVQRALDLLGDRLVGWIQGQFLAMLAVGSLVTLALYLIGAPYALLFGMLNFFTEFIPLLGPWLGGVPAVIVAAVDDPTKGALTAAAMVAIQSLESAVITPLAMADRAEVHPLITLFALLFFGSLFGFLGVLLAVPLVLLVWTVVQVFWVERALHAEDDEIQPPVEE